MDRNTNSMKTLPSRLKDMAHRVLTLRRANPPPQSEAATVTAHDLKEYPVSHTVYYITNEADADRALSAVRSGPIGFDTEFMPRKPTDLDVYLDKLFSRVPGNKKSVILALHALQLEAEEAFVIDWEHVSLCLVQIAKGDEVWLLNMNRIKGQWHLFVPATQPKMSTAFPTELRRILLSHDIAKVGVGVNSDVPVLWYDLGSDVNNFVDCGLMTRLLLTDKYADSAYNFLAMKNAVADVLGLTVSKDLQKSNWRGDGHGHLSDEQKKYAAIDAHASLKLYEHLRPALQHKALALDVAIPDTWYTFNGRYGEPVRTLKTRGDEWAPWTPAVCPWFFGGKFQGYHF